VLHTRTGSVVTVGSFNKPKEEYAQVEQVRRALTSLQEQYRQEQLRQGNRNPIDPFQFFTPARFMPVPQF
jgi:hypothetical protein